MTIEIAREIANLLNSQNKLVKRYTPQMVLKQANDYLREVQGERVLGAVRVLLVQWYQAEISHLSVQPDRGRSGIGTNLLRRAEARAVEMHARIAQCTISSTNKRSIKFFTKNG